jgi:2-keto-3-deoxy-6-phosphogluconate aldolase
MTLFPLHHAIVPVVVFDDERGAEPLAEALTKGGITCAEIAFREVRFFPSGGIRPDTARSYLGHPAVFAIGASWMVSRADIAGGRFDRITRASRAAVTALQLDEANPGVHA